MSEAILVAISPLLVSLVTGGLKKLNLKQVNNKSVFRFVAVVLSFASAVVISVVNGVPVGEETVQLFVNAFIAFIGSQGAYFLAKKPK